MNGKMYPLNMDQIILAQDNEDLSYTPENINWTIQTIEIKNKCEKKSNLCVLNNILEDGT